MKNIAVSIAVVLCLPGPAWAVFTSTGEMCPRNADAQESKKFYEQALGHDKAGRTKEAYKAAGQVNPSCIGGDKAEYKPLMDVLKKTSLKLGEEAENKGRFAEAYSYYKDHHGVPADRVQMKLGTSKPDDFKTVQEGVRYFRGVQESLRGNTRAAKEPDRDARLKAIPGYLDKLQAIAMKNGEKFLADEDKAFGARKTSLSAKGDTLAELNKARDWLGLFGQEKKANDRAVKRGDALLADDSRKSLELAIAYYEFEHQNKEKNIGKVKDKARRLGDAHLKKGEKRIAADYYHLAGLGDKASKLEEAQEAEKEKTEAKRQQKFKQDQKSLEKELGL